MSLRERVVELTVGMGEKFLRALDPYFARHSLVGDRAFFDPAQFPWLAELEAGVPAIQRELDALLADYDRLPNLQDISTEQRIHTDDDRWKTLFFVGYGQPIGRVAERCPETARLLRGVPGLTTAMFSMLSPNKRVPAHVGPYRGVLRFHLALRIPAPASGCGIRVGSEVRHWEEGRTLVFDDVYDHEVWNDTDGVRVVLFMDVKRPLPAIPRLVNEAVIRMIRWSPFVQDAKLRQEAWERRTWSRSPG